MQPSPEVIRAAEKLLAYVRAEIKRGMSADIFNASRPAALHDELKHFLDVYAPNEKRGGRG